MRSPEAIICLFIITTVLGQFEGDRCKVQKTGERGKCVILDNCEDAKRLLMLRQRPQNCGFKGTTPIVCCPDTKTTKPPVSGHISQKQCDIWFPKNRTLSFKKFVFGGVPSLAKEFPHMAVLGYGEKNNTQWLCGGSLISEEFILTAAHCIKSLEYGEVSFVRLGDLDLKNTTDDAKPQDFGVVKTFIHPEYRTSSHYHDIGIIQLEHKAEFGEYVRPACLYSNRTISQQLIATGWGKLDFYGESSTQLMKVNLDYIDYEECAKSYVGVPRLKNGINDASQICAGHPEGKDTCPGDSGGPLQFKTTTASPHFYIVGVTSFGKACGVENAVSVGVYTRVADYLDWIEKIVWFLE